MRADAWNQNQRVGALTKSGWREPFWSELCHFHPHFYHRIHHNLTAVACTSSWSETSRDSARGLAFWQLNADCFVLVSKSGMLIRISTFCLRAQARKLFCRVANNVLIQPVIYQKSFTMITERTTTNTRVLHLINQRVQPKATNSNANISSPRSWRIRKSNNFINWCASGFICDQENGGKNLPSWEEIPTTANSIAMQWNISLKFHLLQKEALPRVPLVSLICQQKACPGLPSHTNPLTQCSHGPRLLQWLCPALLQAVLSTCLCSSDFNAAAGLHGRRRGGNWWHRRGDFWRGGCRAISHVFLQDVGHDGFQLLPDEAKLEREEVEMMQRTW